MSAVANVRIGDFCDTGSGSTPPRDQMARYFDGGTIPWVKSGELRESIINATEEHVTEAALKETSVKLVPANALLVAMYGATVGRLGILGVQATTNQAVCHIVPDPSRADVRYLFRVLETKVSEMLQRTVGGAQPNINQGIVRDLRVPLPPLAEQRRIAAILDQAETLRSQRRAALAQLDSLTQALFMDMFGDPVANPKGFETCLLGDIIDFVGGSQPAKEHFTFEPSQDSIRLVQIRDFRTDEFKTYIPRKLARRMFEVDDVMIGRYGPPVFQIFRGLSGSYNVALMKALPKTGILQDFIFFLLQEPGLHGYVVDRSTRTAGQSGVNLALLENYPAFKPPLALQKSFATRIQAIESLKTTHRTALTELDALFASLQQRAFAGEL